MANIFHRFETSSRAEREQMQLDLMRHYNGLIEQERESFAAVRDYLGHGGKVSRSDHEYIRRLKIHAEIMAALGHVQAVFDILGIEYEPDQPFGLNHVQA